MTLSQPHSTLPLPPGRLDVVSHIFHRRVAGPSRRLAALSIRAGERRLRRQLMINGPGHKSDQNGWRTAAGRRGSAAPPVWAEGGGVMRWRDVGRMMRGR